MTTARWCAASIGRNRGTTGGFQRRSLSVEGRTSSFVPPGGTTEDKEDRGQAPGRQEPESTLGGAARRPIRRGKAVIAKARTSESTGCGPNLVVTQLGQ